MKPNPTRADWYEARHILDTADREHRGLTPDEDARLETLIGKMEETRGAADPSNEALAVANAATGRDPEKSTDPLREMIESGESQRSFAWLPSGYTAIGTDEEVRAIANFSDGGKLHSADFGTRVAIHARTLSPWLGLATVIPADNGRELRIPTITADPTTYTPGEGTAITPSDPTLGTAVLTTVSYKALGYTSYEALEDAEYNLTDAIVQVASRSIGLAAGNAFTTAILAGIANGGTATGVGGYGTATGAFFGYEDLVSLEMGRQAPYRANGVYVGSNGALVKTRKFKDQNGAYFYQPTAGGRGSINNYPIEEDPYLATPGSASKSVLFGDWRAALAIKATPLRVRISHDFKLDTDQIAIRVTGRFGLTVQDSTAAAYLVSANS